MSTPASAIASQVELELEAQLSLGQSQDARAQTSLTIATLIIGLGGAVATTSEDVLGLVADTKSEDLVACIVGLTAVAVFASLIAAWPRDLTMNPPALFVRILSSPVSRNPLTNPQNIERFNNEVLATFPLRRAELLVKLHRSNNIRGIALRVALSTLASSLIVLGYLIQTLVSSG